MMLNKEFKSPDNRKICFIQQKDVAFRKKLTNNEIKGIKRSKYQTFNIYKPKK